jgi:RHS repeat-associated protein
VVTSVSTESKQREVGYLGKQVFELSNHLGNVLATITDKKLQVSLNTTSTAYFEADVQTVQDYYAFGMQMPGRKLRGGYRYGFNGKENDNEVKGEGNQQDYGMRIYDGRIGKFLSVDPLTKQYPELTPYQFASNSPIFAIDRDGLEMFGNNWLFDIWLEWKFGDPTGIKTLKSGLEDKATVQTRQNTYHNNVPQSIETTLDHVNNIQANLKIAAGTSKVVAFNIQTSVDVLSSVVPVEKGAMMAIEALQLSRTKLASSFYKAVGGNVRDITGINFSKSVSEVSLDSKSKLFQWTIDGKLGEYFSTSKSAKNLGLPQMADGTPAYMDRITNTLKPRTLVEVTLPENTLLKGLKSTAKDIEPWDGASGLNKGGDTQIYAPQIKKSNPLIKQVPK